jgi:ribonucleoside-diphosphate reductase alpha chain
MAIAPQRLGIGIRRHFTNPDVHPYDEVEWERRDARITNYRDGAVAFEQLDVEVPETWSLNATNILSQKYFRGTPGTSERESSLKQVADRVVDTITDWGTKDGYFADDEAEAFRAELKHLIIHQKAAFNSPVWFNIGVAGVPQQGSACQPYHALVSTPDGLVPIGKLVEDRAVGAKVLDASGITKIVAVKDNGTKDVLRITTKAGHQLDVTADHLVWRASDEESGEFVPAGDLRIGDALTWHRDDAFSSVEIESIEPLGEMPVFDIQTESGEYLSANLRVHNCFILAVDDTMDSILNWYTEEGVIFKGGSGAGVNLSRIRSSHELLKGGGTASGPVSFMRGADSSAGTIKSGGKTRRAAKMVILDIDHPDIEDFVWCKAIEERKARVLRDAGFDMDLDGKDSISLQYQNANNSVRVTDEFMDAVVAGDDWPLTTRGTGEVVRSVPARDLFRQIAHAAWECADPGMQFDTTINKWHTASNTGRINGSNPCSEYMHLDNSACNLASLNLMKFLHPDSSFDVDGYKAAVEVIFTAQEIIVGNADYPTEKITENSRRFRELGIGYANLGALLMAQGLPYDSDEGRAWAAAITALMTGHAYSTSARIAARMGPFAGFHENVEPMLRVLHMHRDEVAVIDEELVPTDLLSAAQESWDLAVELGEEYGVRNSQASVLAPTGTIGLLMDCDTTGVEPDLGLVKTKKLVGGGTMSIVNQTVPRALTRLGYSPDQVDEIIAYIDEHKTIVGAPYLSADHLPVFACSMGDNTIHYLGHVRMMGAVQPFISGAISKTVNLPEDVSVEDVEQLHIDAWRMGIKAVAVYRDNCKVGQPLSTTKKDGAVIDEVMADVIAGAAAVGGDVAPAGSEAEAHARELTERIAGLERALVHEQARAADTVLVGAVRERLPRRRKSSTFAFRVADCEGYVTVGEYEDGRPGEVFMKVSKQGSTLAGIMDAFSISVSLGLQHGVPLATYVRKYTNMRFEPAGITDDAELRIATSLVDYIFRRLAVDYLPVAERLELGVLSTAERMQPTLPGVEETATESRGISGIDVEDPLTAFVVEGSDPDPTGGSATPSSPGSVGSPSAGQPIVRMEPRDAPYCYQCGNAMQRAGSCYVCGSCGTTSGCS